MYHTTGLSRDQIVEVCARIHRAVSEGSPAAWPPVLGLFNSVVVALTYLRRNRVQVELGETFGVSQSTISRAVTGLTGIIGAVLLEWVPVAEDLPAGVPYIVDGTLLPCWSWADHPELYSGKHHTTGLNVQVACTLTGRLVWISDPIDGARHDNHCLQESAVLTGHDPSSWVGDKGYLGNDMITPIRKSPGRPLLDWQKSFNTQVNQIRWVIEQVIAHFKNWEIVHTDYRRPLNTFRETITTVIALHFYQLAE
jgi:alkylated DNA repair dioxygenase AlkB